MLRASQRPWSNYTGDESPRLRRSLSLLRSDRPPTRTVRAHINFRRPVKGLQERVVVSSLRKHESYDASFEKNRLNAAFARPAAVSALVQERA
jgi:hypothetical protein